MPVEMGLWRFDGVPVRLKASSLSDEKRLEDLLESDLGLDGLDVLVIGRQVPTAHGKVIDLLAVNREGDIVVLELKRALTPRDVVAQTLDYGSWVETLGYTDLAQICLSRKGVPLEVAFAERFDVSPTEDVFNQRHHLFIVASALDSVTERIVDYLAAHGIRINVLFFRYFVDDGREYIARSWLIDPIELESKAATVAKRKDFPPWDGVSFYVTLGEGEHRTWSDAMRYGFVSAGGGPFWSKPLKLLKPGSIVYAYVPGAGYVGAGRVMDPAVRADEFLVEVDGSLLPITQAPTVATKMGEHTGDSEKSEYIVRVHWEHARSKENALWETGMLALPLPVARLRQPFTLERLRAEFPISDDSE